MYNFKNFYNKLIECKMADWVLPLQTAIENVVNKPDGNISKWIEVLKELPTVENFSILKNQIAISIVADSDFSSEDSKKLKETLMKLKPWRKGPFDIFGVYIDSEWRSDMKWERVAKHISPLKNKKVLDVGCGNGYHLFKMAELDPELVIGIDPLSLFSAQFAVIEKYIKSDNVFLLPIGFEELPEKIEAFDTVFSMGVFYHRRSPFDFLKSLKTLLKPNGELILETLVIEGGKESILVPPDRYARMKNVWFIPSIKAMTLWLEKSGFKNIKVADVDKTTTEEQRSTEWMPGDSLVEFLDKNDHTLTVEGLPAPMRAVFICNS